MTNIAAIVDTYQLYILAALAASVVILLILVLILFKRASNLDKRLRKMTRGIENKNIEGIINEYMDKVLTVEKEGNRVKEMYGGIDRRLTECFRKISLKRYRAFEDVGSDLSFSLALLNEMDNGFVLTGLYGRNESTTYMKPIEGGKSRYDLSMEEKQVLKEAMEYNI